jgi:hypothetical protein
MHRRPRERCQLFLRPAHRPATHRKLCEPLTKATLHRRSARSIEAVYMGCGPSRFDITVRSGRSNVVPKCMIHRLFSTSSCSIRRIMNPEPWVAHGGFGIFHEVTIFPKWWPATLLKLFAGACPTSIRGDKPITKRLVFLHCPLLVLISIVLATIPVRSSARVFDPGSGDSDRSFSVAHSSPASDAPKGGFSGLL